MAATAASAWSGSPALATRPGDLARARRRRRDRISAADASSPSALRDESITEAPASANARAMAWPIPREPPVTSAVLPSSRSSMGRHGTDPSAQQRVPSVRCTGCRCGGAVRGAPALTGRSPTRLGTV